MSHEEGPRTIVKEVSGWVHLTAEIETRSGLFKLPSKVLDEQVEMLTWRKTPTFFRGRTAWTELTRPTLTTISGAPPILGLKLKGIGERAVGIDWVEFNQPQTSTFLRTEPHIGIEQDGSIRLVESAPAPRGALLLSRAIAEFEIGTDLARDRIPAITPYCVFRYTDPSLQWRQNGFSESFGVVLSGAPTRDPTRVDALLLGGMQPTPEERTRVKELFNGEPMLPVIAEFARSYGGVLRRFTEAGFFRHSGSLNNWAYSSELGSVYLTDLDSSQRLEAIEPRRRIFEILRDVASGLFNLAQSLSWIRNVQAFTTADVAAVDPFGALLRGFYSNHCYAMASKVSQAFLAYYLPIHERCRELAHAGSRHSVYLDRGVSYCLLLRSLLPLHQADDLSGMYPYQLDLADLDQQILAFLGPFRAKRVFGYSDELFEAAR
jgi:hypothetical protein